MHPSLYDPKLMKPSKLGIDYLLPIFTDAIGETTWSTCADAVRRRQSFAAVSLHQHGRAQAHPLLSTSSSRCIGCPPVPIEGDAEFAEIVSAMAGQSREKDRLLGQYLCPPTSASRLFSTIICRTCR
jgi:hypothetical protein